MVRVHVTVIELAVCNSNYLYTSDIYGGEGAKAMNTVNKCMLAINAALQQVLLLVHACSEIVIMSDGSRTSIHVQDSEPPQSASNPNEQSKSKEDSKSAKLQSAKLYAFHTLIQAVPFFLMLICTVFSQISLVNLTNQLRLHANCSGNATDNDCLDTEDEAEAIAVFWYIVIILMIPNLHTFIKSFMHGVRSQQNLWPSIVSGFVVS